MLVKDISCSFLVVALGVFTVVFVVVVVVAMLVVNIVLHLFQMASLGGVRRCLIWLFKTQMRYL